MVDEQFWNLRQQGQSISNQNKCRARPSKLNLKCIQIIMVCMFLLTDINRAVELLDKLQRTGEVPPQKLQALQRVLQSEFCNAVREVSCFVFVILPTLNCEMA